VNANIMSLGGIAIAIGAMVDAAVVMIENAHKKIERWEQDHPDDISMARCAGSSSPRRRPRSGRRCSSAC
jgi:Cu/Ag efflux pump CusA